jgi:hypothetical protein
MRISINKLTIIYVLVFAAAFSFGVTVTAVEVIDPCGDAGGGGNDIKKITVTSDGIYIILTIEMCVNAEAYEAHTKYFIRIDHKDPNDLDYDNETNEPDTLINNNQDCIKTFEDTKKHWIYQSIEDDFRLGTTELIGNVLTYTVSYAELGLSSGDKVLFWVETYYLGIHERVPNTNSTDRCSMPQLPNEVISLTLNAEGKKLLQKP